MFGILLLLAGLARRQDFAISLAQVQCRIQAPMFAGPIAVADRRIPVQTVGDVGGTAVSTPPVPALQTELSGAFNACHGEGAVVALPAPAGGLQTRELALGGKPEHCPPENGADQKLDLFSAHQGTARAMLAGFSKRASTEDAAPRNICCGRLGCGRRGGALLCSPSHSQISSRLSSKGRTGRRAAAGKKFPVPAAGPMRMHKTNFAHKTGSLETPQHGAGCAAASWTSGSCWGRWSPVRQRNCAKATRMPDTLEPRPPCARRTAAG